MPPGEEPFVSVVLAVRNEADFIERCLSSILDGDYPRDRMEVLVVDGMSDDSTREAVSRLAANDSRIRLLDNTHRIVPHAMNSGIRMAQGEIIIRVDGHAEVAPDFVRKSVETLRAHPECWCVGGPIETISENTVGRTIAAAMSTRVGVGNAMFRLSGYEGYVDTVAFGAHWRWVFDRIGLFDEELVRNQDDEFNARMINAGGRIYMSQAIRSRYYPRTSLRRLWCQYCQYGFWRIRTIQKLGRPAALRQVVPLLFVVGLVLMTLGSVLWRPVAWGLFAYISAYLAGLLTGAWQVARREGPLAFLLSPVVFLILHFAYGLGSLKGIIWFVLLRRSGTSLVSGHALSR